MFVNNHKLDSKFIDMVIGYGDYELLNPLINQSENKHS